MNWYIGQEIVAIKDHPFGSYRKGDETVIRGIKPTCCGNGCDLLTDIRPKFSEWSGKTKCNRCGHLNIGAWYRDSAFAPKQSTYSESEIEAVNVDELTEIINEPEYA